MISTQVLPTGRNTYALDPYRMPSKAALRRGQLAADRILDQHRSANDGAYPETVAVAIGVVIHFWVVAEKSIPTQVTMWGLDAIKTKGESVAMALALVGATVVAEGTGRVARFELMPLQELGRPRVDVLASLSGVSQCTNQNLRRFSRFFERTTMTRTVREMTLRRIIRHPAH